MKTLTALFTAAALTLTAGLAQADVRIDQISTGQGRQDQIP